jgi:hypothetical protein
VVDGRGRLRTAWKLVSLDGMTIFDFVVTKKRTDQRTPDLGQPSKQSNTGDKKSGSTKLLS